MIVGGPNPRTTTQFESQFEGWNLIVVRRNCSLIQMYLPQIEEFNPILNACGYDAVDIHEILGMSDWREEIRMGVQLLLHSPIDAPTGICPRFTVRGGHPIELVRRALRLTQEFLWEEGLDLKFHGVWSTLCAGFHISVERKNIETI